jgi:uncharacterized repeat protein (TIGR01451 family)
MRTAAVLQRIAAVSALFIAGALLVVSPGVGSTASGGLRANAPHRLAATQLSVGLQVTPRTATRRQIVTYRLRVSNTGTTSARLLRVCYQIPPRLLFVSAPAGFVRGGGGLLCRRLASLPVNGTLIFKFRMQVSPSARGGVIISNAYARAAGMVSFVFARAPLTVGVLSPCSAPSC